jgi:hypothetical protein
MNDESDDFGFLNLRGLDAVTVNTSTEKPSGYVVAMHAS